MKIVRPKVFFVWVLGLLQGIALVVVPMPWHLVNVAIGFFLGVWAASLDTMLSKK